MEGHVGEQLKSLRIVVLSGGDSAERDISLQSGAAVEDALSSHPTPPSPLVVSASLVLVFS